MKFPALLASLLLLLQLASPALALHVRGPDDASSLLSTDPRDFSAGQGSEDQYDHSGSAPGRNAVAPVYAPKIVHFPVGLSLGTAMKSFATQLTNAGATSLNVFCIPGMVSGMTVEDFSGTYHLIGTTTGPCSGNSMPITATGFSVANSDTLYLGLPVAALDTCNGTYAITLANENWAYTGINPSPTTNFTGTSLAQGSLVSSISVFNGEQPQGVELTTDTAGLRVDFGNAAGTGNVLAPLPWATMANAWAPGTPNQLVVSVDSCSGGMSASQGNYAITAYLNGANLVFGGHGAPIAVASYRINWANPLGFALLGANPFNNEPESGVGDFILWTGSSIGKQDNSANLVCQTSAANPTPHCPGPSSLTASTNFLMSPSDLAQFGHAINVSTAPVGANFATNATTATLATSCPPSVGYGQMIVDLGAGGNAGGTPVLIGTVNSCVGSTLTFNPKSIIGENKGHVLKFYNWVGNDPVQMAAAFQSVLGPPDVVLKGPAVNWSGGNANLAASLGNAAATAVYPSWPPGSKTATTTYTAANATPQDLIESPAFVSAGNPIGIPAGKGGYAWHCQTDVQQTPPPVLASTCAGGGSGEQNGAFVSNSEPIAIGDWLTIQFSAIQNSAIALPDCGSALFGPVNAAGVGGWTLAGGTSAATKFALNCVWTKIATANEVGVTAFYLTPSVASAVVNAAGSSYTNGTGTMTWSGTGCTTPPVLNVTVAGNVVSAVNSVATPGVCQAWPAAAATSWTASGLGAGSGASFTLTAAIPTPPTRGAMAYVTDYKSNGPNKTWTIDTGTILATAASTASGTNNIPLSLTGALAQPNDVVQMFFAVATGSGNGPFNCPAGTAKRYDLGMGFGGGAASGNDFSNSDQLMCDLTLGNTSQGRTLGTGSTIGAYPAFITNTGSFEKFGLAVAATPQ